jgi:CRISPR-associated protein Cmr6
MGSRRNVLEGIEPQATTHTALWLEMGMLDVAAKDSAKQNHLDQVLRTVAVPGDYVHFFRRWKESLKALEPCTLLAEATALGRMVVGLGAESVLETSLAFHRTYGVPYIPGSALKGLAASAAHRFLQDEEWKKQRSDGKIGEAHRVLFGDQDFSGFVTFHDGLWIPPANAAQLPLDLDVMTVHHPQYYQGKAGAPPADWDSPTPVAFLSTRGSYLVALTGPKDWAEAALDILIQALKHEGIGAKTAAGYGRMSVVSLQEESAHPKAAGTAQTQPASPIWEARVRQINPGNADHYVPDLLKDLSGEERRRAARAVIEHLGKKVLKRHAEKEWAKSLLEAANA